MPLRRHVPGRVRAAGPGPYDVLPVPQAPARAGRAWRRTCFTGSCTCARARGWGGCRVVAGDGVKIAANASKEASRTEAGLRKLAAQVMDGARKAAAADDADWNRCCPAQTCCWAGTRRRARIRGRGPGGCWPAWRTWKASGRPPRRTPASRGRPTWRRWRPAPRRPGGPRPRWPLAAGAAAAGEGHRRRGGRARGLAGPPGRRAAGQPARRPGPAPARRPARPAPAWRPAGRRPPPRRGRKPQAGDGKKPGAAAQRHRPGLPADAGPRRRVHPGIQLPGRRRR